MICIGRALEIALEKEKRKVAEETELNHRLQRDLAVTIEQRDAFDKDIR